jgi:Holin of 3TMs, for gene-transfer release
MSAIVSELVAPVSELARSIVNAIAPDKTQVEKDTASYKIAQLIADSDAFKARAGIVAAEAQSGSWLTRSWRPITMLTFLWLIVSYWYGWHAANLSDALVDQLFQIIKIGLGGYVVGRSAEKVAPVIAAVLKRG